MARKIISSFVLLIVVLPFLRAQSKEKRVLSGFDAISVSNAINLYLKEGTQTFATVVADGIELDRVITEISGSKLKIYLKRNYSWKRNSHVKVYVTYKTLNYLSASSASDVYSETVVKSENLDIKASSAASIQLNLQVNKLQMSASSAADIDLKGHAIQVKGAASSAGDIDAYYLTCKKASLRASSAGDIRIQVTDKIEARASSGGSVKYKGNPSHSDTNSSSGGSVRKL